MCLVTVVVRNVKTDTGFCSTRCFCLFLNRNEHQKHVLEKKMKCFISAIIFMIMLYSGHEG